MRPLMFLTTAFFLAVTSVQAGPISFASGWAEQKLSLFSSNDYNFGQNLSMVSDGSVSIAWTALPRAEWRAQSATWNWTVEASVPATDLARKGGDDRNLSVYFVFLPDAQAEALAGANIRQLLGNKDVRVLQYVWGGNYGRGTLVPSPYQVGQGTSVALRPAGTGSFAESVNFGADYTRAFGGTPGPLVGLAVSGDSDDTGSVIRAAIGNLQLN